MYSIGYVKGPPAHESGDFPEPAIGSTILVVSRQTGLGMETLRAWERRYGFPKPERRAGSNRRLYSATDILRLVAIRRAIDAGYRVGDAITKTIHELEVMAGGPSKAAEGQALTALSIDALIQILRDDDVARLEDELRKNSTILGTKRFVTELAHPFVVAVGEAWAAGTLAIRHEHLATECVTTRLRQMLAAYQDIEGDPLVLLTTLPGEPHGLGLQMVALYLAVKSARPRMLGISTPVDQIVDTARVLRADVVGLTISPNVDPETTRAALAILRSELPAHIRIWLGGAGARTVFEYAPNTHLVPSWEAIDEALGEWRRAS
jgi:MerR family transcriptional regulator, light-induced transcriptional regulator